MLEIMTCLKYQLRTPLLETSLCSSGNLILGCYQPYWGVNMRNPMFWVSAILIDSLEVGSWAMVILDRLVGLLGSCPWKPVTSILISLGFASSLASRVDSWHMFLDWTGTVYVSAYIHTCIITYRKIFLVEIEGICSHDPTSIWPLGWWLSTKLKMPSKHWAFCFSRKCFDHSSLLCTYESMANTVTTMLVTDKTHRQGESRDHVDNPRLKWKLPRSKLAFCCVLFLAGQAFHLYHPEL